jgi:PhzF family phenazine biosynthesis protein
MMNIQRIAAFALNGQGGNPAGVVLLDKLPDTDVMQKVAAEVGYSETVFAAPQDGGFRTRYFAPEAEVAFCGHATIALGAALGAANGEGVYPLILNDTEVSVEAVTADGGWSSILQSPKTGFRVADPELVVRALKMFGWNADDIDPTLEITQVNGGAEHLLIPLKTHISLQNMEYNFDTGAALMQEFHLVTINLIWRDENGTIHSRNPFAGHGVYEDPATGAAAAALAGYLRDAGHSDQPFDIFQGEDMGVASFLRVTPLQGKGAAVKISGATRAIEAP